MCEKGQTFLIPSGADKHLFVVVTEADNNGMHILVNVSSIDSDISHDKTCVFEAGEHDFIKHPSYAAYEFAIQRHKNFIDDKAKRKVYEQHRDASPALVSKICNGIKKSYFTRRSIKDGFDAALRAASARQKAGLTGTHSP